MILDEPAENTESCEDEELALIWEDDVEKETEPAISLHAITGGKGNHTIKIAGQMKKKTISILVDSGSTHNFVSQSLVK